MTKQRLMLSAAMAALLAGAVAHAQADTTVANTRKTAIDTGSSGNIIIDNGAQIQIKAANPAVAINSSNSVINAGGISNTNTGNATGVLIDTSNGNLVTSTGFQNYGTIDLTGDGANKSAIAIVGGNTFFGPITLGELTSGSAGTATTSTISTVTLKGDNSYLLYLAQGTTVDGDISLGGVFRETSSKDSTASQTPMFQFEGNINGNLTFDNQTSATSIGNGAAGVVILGPITPCVSNSGLGYTCANTTTESGAFVNSGSISVAGVGVAAINSSSSNKNNFPESGPALVIANSISGGVLNNGPSTGSANTVTALLAGNGAIVGGVPNPVLLIDPSQSITATNLTIRGPVTLGIVSSAIDPIDGASATNPGYSLINHGLITAAPVNANTSSIAVVIQGASPINYTCLGVYTGGACQTNYATNGGGLLDTGTITATSTTSVKGNSTTTATAVSIGAFATVPRFVVSGEPTSGTTYTPGNVVAYVTGPGGGSATGLNVGNLAKVPEIDVLSHGSITAQITTTTLSPTPDIASTRTPFIQSSVAIIDTSGSVKLINNAGTIAALTTQQTATANAVTQTVNHAIDLSGGSNGGTTINNSGVIQGDVFFNSGGNGNTLNVGNTGGAFTDNSGAANMAITLAQGSAVTNSPSSYASISERIDSQVAGQAPLTDAATINFGAGQGNELHVGGFGYVNATIISAAGGLDIRVDNNGTLFLARPTTGSVNVGTLNVDNGGTLGLTIAQNTSATPVIQGTGAATIAPNAIIGLQFGTFISSGTTAASTAHPTAQVITLINAPTVTDSGLANQNTALSQAIPFLFESPTEAGYSAGTPLKTGMSGGNQTLTLTLLPRSTGKTNADGTAGLDLSGAALKLFPYTASALGNDPTLGAAIATNLTVYNNNTGAPSGINIAASQQKAQQIFSQFAPDASGAARAVAILITDQATGPVAARQRLLRSYGKQDGDLTLWGTEFFGMVNNKGRFDGEGDLTSYKDHGVGFSLGMDAGSARTGWYGGALTFYAGDAVEALPRASKTHMQWYMLTGYSDWRGKHVFLDTTGSLGYGGFKGQRDLSIGDQVRAAIGRRSGELVSLGATTGVYLKYGSLDVVPHVSLDGMTMREEGYTENGGGNGLDLQVAPYYASSLRAFLGADVKENVSIFGATVSPEARLGYRYDFIGSPVKLKAAFASTGGLNSPGNSFTFKGPDPDTGDAVVGLSLGAGTGDWHLGINYDWVRGNNASTTQVGTFTLLGRI